MKKLLKIIAVVAIFVAPMLISQSVFAEVNCTISNTGPGSTNECIAQEERSCSVINENTISVGGENLQFASSGSGSVDDDTTGGEAVSGTVTNKNGETINVTVENGECVAVVAVANPEGGRGAITPPKVTKPTVLPTTGGDISSEILVALAGIMGAVAVASGLVMSARRRL